MKRDAILDSLAILGSIITAVSFIEEPFFKRNKITFLILGVLILIIYTRLYVEEKAISWIRLVEKRLNSVKVSINNRMDKQDKEVSRINGWMEAINFFKDKKGAIDPITLILILIIVIIIILALQGKL